MYHYCNKRQSPSASDSIPPNWFEAFQRLITYLEQIEAARKKVVFLDELPWLDTKRSDFMIAFLEHFWKGSPADDVELIQTLDASKLKSASIQGLLVRCLDGGSAGFKIPIRY